MNLKALVKTLGKGGLLVPHLMDYLAKEDRLVQSGKISRKAAVMDDAKMTIECMKERIKEYNHDEDPVGEFFHPSQIGGCMRRTWLRWFKAPSEQSDKGKGHLGSLLTFEVGTYFHILFQNLLQRAGLLIERESAIIDSVNRIIGHCDGKVRVDAADFTLEIKTINDRGFARVASQPEHAHKAQLHCYMKSLKMKRGIIVYFNKNSSELKEYVVEFDEAFYKEHCESRIELYFKKVRAKKPPEREGAGPSSPPCSYCEYIGLCYSEDSMKKFVKKL